MGDFGYLIGRVILTFIAFCAACLGALITLGIGLQKHLFEDAGDPGSALLLGGFLFIAVVFLGLKLLFPAFLIILATEAFAWRSIWLYLAMGVGVALATEWVLLLFDGDEIHPSPSKLLIASGLIGGFIYWLIAGRSAGRLPPSSPPVVGTIDRP
jgi:hypothetical protein